MESSPADRIRCAPISGSWRPLRPTAASGRIPLRQSQAVEGSAAVGGGGPHRCGYGGVDLPELPLGVRQVEVPADVMKSVSPMETPQGTLFICAIHTEPLPEMLTGRRYVVLDTLQDPGNVGTILRTADAFHADGMFLVNGCADLYNPKTLRATMGAVFRCPVWTVGAENCPLC